MISCEEAARLLSESYERRLPIWKRLALRLHLAMCRLCGGYAADQERIRSAIQRRRDDPEDQGLDESAVLSPAAKSRIKSFLSKSLGP